MTKPLLFGSISIQLGLLIALQSQKIRPLQLLPFQPIRRLPDGGCRYQESVFALPCFCTCWPARVGVRNNHYSEHPGKAGQESVSEKGIAKVMLLCLCGDADFETGVVTNAAFAQPAAAAGMQLILNCPRVVRALVLSDLMHQNFMLAKDHDPTHIMSWELPMTNQ